jgi:hypothetical protein
MMVDLPRASALGGGCRRTAALTAMVACRDGIAAQLKQATHKIPGGAITVSVHVQEFASAVPLQKDENRVDILTRRVQLMRKQSQCQSNAS